MQGVLLSSCTLSLSNQIQVPLVFYSTLGRLQDQDVSVVYDQTCPLNHSYGIWFCHHTLSKVCCL